MGTKDSVLIVDDDPGLRETLSDILRAKEYAPIAVGRGKEALDRVQVEMPAVALIDLRLDDMSGLALLEEIRRRSPDTQCIVLTGDATQESAIEAINLGAYGYVQKPYDMDQLLVTIHRAVEKREAKEILRESKETLQRLLDQQIAVNRLALTLGESRDIGEIYHIIHEHIHPLMDADAFIVSSYDDETQLIQAGYMVSHGAVRDVTNFPPIPLERTGHGTQSQVIHTGKPFYVPDWRRAMRTTRTEYKVAQDGTVSEGPPPAEQQKDSVNSAIYVPMKIEGKTIGVMQAQSNRLDAYTQEDIDLLSALANVAAIAIQNARLYEETRRRGLEQETLR
ncbi:MAG: response regulator [Anaerolineae bacterium]|nr:response regulator [Anaerolineae bacterium]